MLARGLWRQANIGTLSPAAIAPLLLVGRLSHAADPHRDIGGLIPHRCNFGADRRRMNVCSTLFDGDFLPAVLAKALASRSSFWLFGWRPRLHRHPCAHALGPPYINSVQGAVQRAPMSWATELAVAAAGIAKTSCAVCRSKRQPKRGRVWPAGPCDFSLSSRNLSPPPLFAPGARAYHRRAQEERGRKKVLRPGMRSVPQGVDALSIWRRVMVELLLSRIGRMRPMEAGSKHSMASYGAKAWICGFDPLPRLNLARHQSDGRGSNACIKWEYRRPCDDAGLGADAIIQWG